MLHNRTKSDASIAHYNKLEHNLDVAIATIQQLQDQLVRVNSELEDTAKAKANMTRDYMEAIKQVEELQSKTHIPKDMMDRLALYERDVERYSDGEKVDEGNNGLMKYVD